MVYKDYGLRNKKRIGNPDLFTGRKEELAYFFKWINGIKERKSQSTVLMALRKMGKNTLMERLFKENSGLAKFSVLEKTTHISGTLKSTLK